MAAKGFYTQKQKSIVALYALITVGAVLCMVQISLLPYAGLASLSVGFIAAYIYRFKNKGDDFMTFHTNYIIRMMWWSTLILLIGIALFGCIIFFNGDLSAIHALMSQAESGVLPQEADIHNLQISFVQVNLKLILIAAAVCLLPYPLYILVKSVKGVKIVQKEG